MSMIFIVALLNGLNGFDAACTLMHIISGRADEMNPLMKAAMDVGPVFFVIVKFLAVLGGSILLAREGYYHVLTWLTLLLTLVSLWHVVGWRVP